MAFRDSSFEVWVLELVASERFRYFAAGFVVAAVIAWAVP